jgi:glycosyltransferase involved in cell wall biosynthesis
MRTAALMRYLAAKYILDAIFFREQGQPDPRPALPAGLVSDTLLIDLPRHDRGVLAKSFRNAKRCWDGVPPLNDRFSGFEQHVREFCAASEWRVAVVEHSWCASYGPVLAQSCASVILDLHNIESVLHARCGDSEPWPLSSIHRRFASCGEQLERAAFPRFDLILAASAHDRAVALSLAPGARVEVYPNTVPEPESKHIGKRRQIVFSGNMEYHPNRAAVRWFAAGVWPRLRATHPDLEWVLVGKNPDAVRHFVAGDPRVRLTGEVEDARAEIANSLVAVVPLLSGSGTRIKILEAWSMGVPVVSTTIGAEGLPHSGLVLADSVLPFFEAVSLLLNDDGGLGERGKALFSENFTWTSGWNVLDRLGI